MSKRYATGMEGARVKKKARYGGAAAAAVSNPSGRQTVPRTMGAFAQTERKYFTSLVSADGITTSTNWASTELDPAANSMFTPQEGSDIDNRVGRRVEVVKIQVRGNITCAAQPNQTAAQEPTLVRLILCQDMQTNGTQMSGEELMQPPATATAPLAVCSFQNPANFGRFRVLKDKLFTLTNPALTYDGTNIEQNGLVKAFKWTIKFQKPIEVRFNSTNGGTIGDIVNNSFHMIGSASNADLTPTISYQARFVYTDK